MKHHDEAVSQALIRLDDALCSWERATGRSSVLIIREEGGFEHRSMNGKPIEVSLPDADLMRTVREASHAGKEK